MTKEQFKQQAHEMLQDGRVLEAGWIVNLRMGAPPEATENELYVARCGFFFGARFMLEIMVDAQRASEQDLRRTVANLRKELETFGAQLVKDAGQDEALH